ncbi:MAG: UvrD-helicase domain-containing protein, partial [Desulfobacula sp.]|nr:UvrD-helicase domain-containing protein [Desulfobacula sp.]
MEFIADLHLHSKYSRATAKNLDFEHLYRAAQIKGVTVVGTGDFTHPEWIEQIELKLEEAEPGLFTLKKKSAKEIDKTIPENCRGPVRFILQCEISNIYKKNDKVRKNHNLVYFPDIKSVKKFNAALDAIGNIKSDGRPILGLDAEKLLALMLDINDHGMFIPAHIWTPWFSLFGSKSGFDSMAECFGDLTDRIFAVETGLSSDPPMNWRIEELDNIRLISNSDAHSPGFLGRNASVFNTGLSFSHIRKALEVNDLDAFKGTLDMFPHQGKYHYDGHRKCNVCLNPAATAQLDGICPECGKPVTCGVLYRVQELATRPEGYRPENRHGYQSMIPLADILSEIFEVGPKTKKVATFYNKAIERLGPELGILLDKSYQQIESANVPLLADAIMKMRAGDINIDPGFDGEFGVVNIFTTQEKEALKGEKNLLCDFPGKKKKPRVRKALAHAGSVAGIKNKKKSKPVQKKAVHIGTNDALLKGLNPEQKKAVESNAKSMVVQAGPGTGKTRTLTAKIAWLVSQKNVDPGNILALTFTNKAAKELEKRIERYLPKTGEKRKSPNTCVLSATFHSFCLKLLKQYKKDFSASILEDGARMDLIRDAIGAEAKRSDIKKAEQFISRCKQNLLFPKDDLSCVVDGEGGQDFKNTYELYQHCCAKENVIDFEDLIFMTVELLNDDKKLHAVVSESYPYVFIDEYQDLNYGQYVLAKLLAANNYILVIGDPDQSIYGFRGSDNKYFKLFETDFPGCEKIFLNINYRSTQTILDASGQVIRSAGDTQGKSVVFSGIKGLNRLIIKEAASEMSEAVAVSKMIEKFVGGISFFSMDRSIAGFDEQKEYSFADFAILYRTSKLCDAFVDIFEKEGIPYQTADKKRFFEIEGIKQLISLCRIMAGCETFYDVKIVFDHFGVKLGKKSGTVFQRAYKETRILSQDFFETIILPDDGSIRAPVQVKINDVLEKLKGLKNKLQSENTTGAAKMLYEEAELKARIQADESAKYAYNTLEPKTDIVFGLTHVTIEQDKMLA